MGLKDKAVTAWPKVLDEFWKELKAQPIDKQKIEVYPHEADPAPTANNTIQALQTLENAAATISKTLAQTPDTSASFNMKTIEQALDKVATVLQTTAERVTEIDEKQEKLAASQGEIKRQRPPNPNIICYKCNEMGHPARLCPQPRRLRFQNNSQQGNRYSGRYNGRGRGQWRNNTSNFRWNNSRNNQQGRSPRWQNQSPANESQHQRPPQQPRNTQQPKWQA